MFSNYTSSILVPSCTQSMFDLFHYLSTQSHFLAQSLPFWRNLFPKILERHVWKGTYFLSVGIILVEGKSVRPALIRIKCDGGYIWLRLTIVFRKCLSLISPKYVYTSIWFKNQLRRIIINVWVPDLFLVTSMALCSHLTIVAVNCIIRRAMSSSRVNNYTMKLNTAKYVTYKRKYYLSSLPSVMNCGWPVVQQ
jgi:hypothetical protein